jgi:hypothetical protein
MLLAAVVAVGLASCRGGCSRVPREARPLDGRLALFPIETRSLVALDLDKVRAAPMSSRLASLAIASAADQQRLDAFRERTGLDPGRQIQSVIVGFPEEARVRGELGIVVRAARFDEARLVAYVRDALQKDGDDLVPTTRGRRTLWAARKDPALAGFFLDGRTLVVGGGGWATRMADLSDAKEAQALVGKVNETLQGAKRDRRVLMLGLGPDIDGVTSRADGTTFSLRMSLGETQVADLLERAAAFLSLARQGRAPGFGH